MFWKRFYFVVVLLSCNCFLLCGSWTFCKRLKNIFGYGSSETEDNILNLNDANYKNQQRNQYEYTFNNLNNNYNSSNNEDCDINDFDNQYNNLEGVDFSTLELLNEQTDINTDNNKSCIFLSATDYRDGKTSIINRARNGDFDENIQQTSTPLVFYFPFKANNDIIILLQSFDIPCKKEYKFKAQDSYKNHDAIIFVYDICNARSFDELKKHQIKEVKNIANKNTLFFLLGNKLDRDLGVNSYRAITTDEAENFAKDNNLIFLGECSARDNQYMPATENTCYKEKKMKEVKYCTDGVTGIFKDILYNIVKKQKSQGE